MRCRAISALSVSQVACCAAISRRASASMRASCRAGVSPSGEGVALPGPRQRPQARDAHGVELVEVGGRDRQEPQPLQQRHARVLRLLQHAPVEAEPGQLAVEEARGPGHVGGRGHRGGKGGLEEVGIRTSVFLLGQPNLGSGLAAVEHPRGPATGSPCGPPTGSRGRGSPPPRPPPRATSRSGGRRRPAPRARGTAAGPRTAWRAAPPEARRPGASSRTTLVACIRRGEVGQPDAPARRRPVRGQQEPPPRRHQVVVEMEQRRLGLARQRLQVLHGHGRPRRGQVRPEVPRLPPLGAP